MGRNQQCHRLLATCSNLHFRSASYHVEYLTRTQHSCGETVMKVSPRPVKLNISTLHNYICDDYACNQQLLLLLLMLGHGKLFTVSSIVKVSIFTTAAFVYDSCNYTRGAIDAGDRQVVPLIPWTL